MHTDEWYSVFWDCVVDNTDEDGFNAVRILGEMYSDNVFYRNGDSLIGKDGNTFTLTKEDQFLVRRIIEAALEASSVSDGI